MRTRSRSSGASGTLVRLPVRRRSDRIRRALTVALVVVLAGAGFGSWAAASWRVREIRVVGQEMLGADRIVRASRLTGGERILLTRMGGVANRVEAVPGVGAVSVERDLPHTVVIRVRERIPLVAIEGTDLVAGADGVLFRVPGPQAVPVLADPDGARPAPGRSLSRRWVRVLSDYAGFPAEITDRAARLSFEDAGFTITLREGAEIVFGRLEHLEAKAVAAASVLQHAAAAEEPLAYVDVRVPRAPVAKPVGAAVPNDDDGSAEADEPSAAGD